MNLNQVTIPSLDVSKSVLFYERLGLKLIVRSLPDYVRFECPGGGSSFSIQKRDKLSSGTGVYIYFECDELDKHVHDLIEKGIEFDELPTDKRWLWREARLLDPDGNQLILYYAGENRLNPPWRLNLKE